MKRLLMILACLLALGCMILSLWEPGWLPGAAAAVLWLTGMALTAQADSERDPLTELGNLRALYSRGKKYRRCPRICVVYLDLDDLKGRNDSLGHAAGDDALRHVAKILRGLPGDAYRVGGDEFLVISPTPLRWTPPEELPISLGTAEGPGRDLDDLIRRAEAEMYRNKDQ